MLLGPGSYDPRLPTGAPVAVREESRDDGSIERIQLWKRGAEVPFQSSEGKFAVYSRAIASKTPGPGTYAPECPLGDKAAGYGLKSRSARLAPLAHGSSQFTASSSVHNPGPGSYFEDAAATAADAAAFTKISTPAEDTYREDGSDHTTSKASTRVRSRCLEYCWDKVDQESSAVEETAIPMMEYTGDRADTCGPAHYSIESARRLTAPAVRNAQWHKYREERKVFQPSHTVENTQPDPVVPGPGQYHLMNYNNRKLPPLGTSQFEVEYRWPIRSYHHRRDRSLTMILPQQLIQLPVGSLSTSSADLGHCGHFNAARVAIESHKAAVAPFSSSVPRSDAWARTVEAPFTTPHTAGPGPGSYRHQASSSSKDGVTVLARECVARAGGDSYTTRTIRHKLNAVEGVHVRRSEDPVVALGEHRRYYGVHNPLHVAIVSEALDNRQPISAFDSTDGRPCNKPLPQGTPGPDQYATGETLSISKFVSAKAAVGRKGSLAPVPVGMLDRHSRNATLQ
ncbi:hypothetical protein FOZ60_002123 [Perkinsus olseni]|uniref:Uncharacterized protein n=1 Tax=Perkinsus olseni TaxID=32597 RepID=A0A7J6NYP5_PEROL|nr:hypothetical protein FOZ60_002123 [Perkinsus olseni]